MYLLNLMITSSQYTATQITFTDTLHPDVNYLHGLHKHCH